MPKDSEALLWLVRPRNLAVIVAATLAGASPLAGQLAPPTTGGVGELDWLLQRLAEPRRVLMIGAHPDDEDTGLLSLMARGYGAEAAYLSLSRGEGGQNLIGLELGQALGLLRSQELVAARAIDGAQQFFTRGFDFGYTRSLEETNQYWPPDTLTKDAVRIVRRFRPHVIVSVFSGTPRDGHGQHQAAGVTAHRAFELASDPDAFPELATDEGLEPWTPLKFFRSTRFDPSSTNVRLEVGGLDQRVGQSFHQIAMASRSQHRSQDMGRTQPIGPSQASVRLLEDRTGSADGFFSGIEIGSSRLRDIADSLRSVLHPANPSGIVPGLVHALQVADGAHRDLISQAIGNAAGLMIDGIAQYGEVVPGQSVDVEVSLYNAGPYLVELAHVGLATPNGWRVHHESDFGVRAVAPGELASFPLRVEVPRSARLSQPYFLERPRSEGLYDWSDAPPAARGLPFAPPAVQVEVVIRLMGSEVALRRELTHRTSDQAVGEIRKPFLVRPRVAVEITPDQLIWPSGSARVRRFTVTATHYGDTPYRGDVQLQADGWPDIPAQRFAFQSPGQSQSFVFEVTRPENIVRSSVAFRASAVGDDGVVYRSGIETLRYPHIRVLSWTELADSRVEIAPIGLPPIARIGYIRGAADRVPEALVGVGLPIELLGGADLAQQDLSGFDAIVVGSRAYETDSALTKHNDRLLEYVRNGGHLVVQYQQYSFVGGGFAPYPLDIGRPHDRITDENAPVRVLDPDSPVFRQPNPITGEDWDNWPQERGLYFPSTWDDHYTPLLEMSDPDREPVQGALLLAEYGAGTYVYTGISFFRSLPAGVVGAFKLFFNILSIRPADVP